MSQGGRERWTKQVRGAFSALILRASASSIVPTLRKVREERGTQFFFMYVIERVDHPSDAIPDWKSANSGPPRVCGAFMGSISLFRTSSLNLSQTTVNK